MQYKCDVASQPGWPQQRRRVIKLADIPSSSIIYTGFYLAPDRTGIIQLCRAVRSKYYTFITKIILLELLPNKDMNNNMK